LGYHGRNTLSVHFFFTRGGCIHTKKVVDVPQTSASSSASAEAWIYGGRGKGAIVAHFASKQGGFPILRIISLVGIRGVAYELLITFFVSRVAFPAQLREYVRAAV